MLNNFKKAYKCLLVLLGVSIVVSGVASSSFAEVQWRKYKGRTVRFLAFKLPVIEAMRALAPEFEKKTGIKIKFELLSAWEMRAKMKRELIAAKKDLDMFLFTVSVQAPWIARGNFLADQEKFIHDPTLTPPDWGWPEKFLTLGKLGNRVLTPHAPLAFSLGGRPDGIWYRKDLFEKYGIDEQLRTFDEVEEAAKKFSAAADIIPYIARGDARQSVANLAGFLWGYGGAYLTQDRKPAVAKPESIRGFTEYGRFLREYGPPNPLGIGWLEAAEYFSKGRVAMFYGTAAHVSKFVQAGLADKIGFVCNPAGPAGRCIAIKQITAGIPRFSPDKEAAWLFIQWFNNEENSVKALNRGVSVTRASAWKSPNAQPPQEDWAKATQYAMEHGRCRQLPLMMDIDAARDIITKIMIASIKGEPVEPVAQEAAKELEKLLKEEEEKGIEWPDLPERYYMPYNCFSYK